VQTSKRWNPNRLEVFFVPIRKNANLFAF